MSTKTTKSTKMKNSTMRTKKRTTSRKTKAERSVQYMKESQTLKVLYRKLLSFFTIIIRSREMYVFKVGDKVTHVLDEGMPRTVKKDSPLKKQIGIIIQRESVECYMKAPQNFYIIRWYIERSSWSGGGAQKELFKHSEIELDLYEPVAAT